jgi:hypothetical protein
MPTPNNARDHTDWKLRAAQRALQLVESGMMLGLGSGSTATLWIKLLGEQVRDHGLKIRAIASSEDSERLDQNPKLRFTSLAHLLTPEFLTETWRQMNRRGASGVDGETIKEFEQDLDTRVQELCERLKRGTEFCGGQAQPPTDQDDFTHAPG